MLLTVYEYVCTFYRHIHHTRTLVYRYVHTYTHRHTCIHTYCKCMWTGTPYHICTTCTIWTMYIRTYVRNCTCARYTCRRNGIHTQVPWDSWWWLWVRSWRSATSPTQASRTSCPGTPTLTAGGHRQRNQTVGEWEHDIYTYTEYTLTCYFKHRH